MHLSARHGSTIEHIRADGFEPAAELAWLDGPADPPADVQAAAALAAVGAALRSEPSDALVLVGDRFETAAAAVAATVTRVPIVHLHGGEQTLGAFDDPLRHAITKLSHLHLVSDEEHARRVVALGEDPATIHVVGAPGLDAAFRTDLPDRAGPRGASSGIALPAPVVIVAVHPATLDPDPSAVVEAVIGAMTAVPATYVVTLPNADPGADEIRRRLQAGRGTWLDGRGGARSAAVLGPAAGRRRDDRQQLRGLIEAPAVDLPAVNVGDRQEGRRREANVIDAPVDARRGRGRPPASTRPGLPGRCRHRPSAARRRAGGGADRGYHRRMATVRSAAQGADPGRAVTARPLVIVGGGEHARVVIEAAGTRPDLWQVVGIVDPAPADRTRTLFGVDHLGDDDDLASRLDRLPEARPALVRARVRRTPTARRGAAAAVERLAPRGPLGHGRPRAGLGLAERRPRRGERRPRRGDRECGGDIGRHAIVNTRAVLEHDVVLGDHVHVGPGAVLGGGSRRRRGCRSRARCRRSRSVEVGAGATVGMGAVVVGDVASGTVVAGSPARPLGGLVADRLDACLVSEERHAPRRDASPSTWGLAGSPWRWTRRGRLVGVATDGDVRRALLGGASLERPASAPLLHPRFVARRPARAAPRRSS